MKGRRKKVKADPKVEAKEAEDQDPLVSLAQLYGYDLIPVEHDSLAEEVKKNIVDELRMAVRVALLDSDNKNRRNLTLDSIDIVKHTSRIFPAEKPTPPSKDREEK